MPPGVTSAAQCQAAQAQDPVLNCWQTLELCPDGRAGLILSDIVNDGRYTTRDATIDVRFGSASDGSLLIFAIQADGALLAADLGSVAFARSLDAPARCAEPP